MQNIAVMRQRGWYARYPPLDQVASAEERERLKKQALEEDDDMIREADVDGDGNDLASLD